MADQEVEGWNEKLGDDAITRAHGEGKMCDSCWGRITWAEWVEREVERMNHGRKKPCARVARGHGYLWIVRVGVR